MEVLNVDLLESILTASLPKENAEDDEDYDELLSELLDLEITTPTALKELISKRLAEALERDKQRVVGERNRDPPIGTSKERIQKGVFFTHVGLARTMLDLEFGKVWRSRVRTSAAVPQSAQKPANSPPEADRKRKSR